MIRVTFLTERPTDIVIRDGKTYVSVAPVDNAMWGACYEEIEVLRGKDYGSTRGTHYSTSGRHRPRGSDDPYGFSGQRRYFPPRGDDRVKPDPVMRQFLAYMKAGTITREEFYRNLYNL